MMKIAHIVDGRTKTGAISSVRRIMAHYHYNDQKLILVAYGSPLTKESSEHFQTDFIDLKFPKTLSKFVISPFRYLYLLPNLSIYFFMDIQKLRNYCKVKGINCLHLHHFADILQLGFLKSKDLKIVSHIRAIVNKSLWKGLPYKIFRYFSFRNSNKIIGISKEAIKTLNYPDSSKTVIIYNGLEGLNKSENDSLYEKCKDSFIIGSVIRFAKLKGIDLFFETFFMYFKLHPKSSIKFLLIAPAIDEKAKEIRTSFFKKVKDSNLESQLIYFEHFPNYSFIMPYIDVLYHTTLQREGFGNVVLEAAWFGKPAISTPCKGVNDIIESGRSGFIMEGYSPKEACDYIHKFENDNTEYLHFSQRAFDIAHSQAFSIEKTIELLHNIYINI